MAPEAESDLKMEIAHVLTMDVVEYSTLLITEQSRVMAELTFIVKKTERFRRAEAEGKLVRIPTGDGMALVFFDDPKAPIECAMEIAAALKSHPEIRLRMGIHSGPVNPVVDVSDRSNVAGAGIDMAQRVMDCGDAGHILLSKRVADDLAPFPRWNPYLHELGECEVKHGRKISLVNFYTDEIGNPNLPQKCHAQRQRTARAAPTPSAILIGSSVLLIALLIGLVKFSRLAPNRRAVTPANAKSIAVLPFENLSHDPENAYFADGIQEEILTRLSKIADLKVISSTSTQRYKSKPENLSQIANQLGVAHILEGAVQKSADQVRVNVQLIDAQTDSHVWAEKFDRKLTDIFAVESEIATKIADTFETKLTGSEKHALNARPTENPVAYQYYLKGRYFWNKRTANDFKTAVTYFEQAVDSDPRFALAYAGLADTYVLMPAYTAARPRDAFPKAKAVAQKALELDDTLAEAHTALAMALARYEFDFTQAAREFRRAVELNPNYGTAHHWYGNTTLIALARFDEAIAEMKRALDLDPLSLIANADLGRAYLCARWFDEGIAQLRKTLELDRNFYVAHWMLGQGLEFKGLTNAAIVEYENAHRLDDDPYVLGLLGHAYAVSGRRDDALKMLAQLNDESARRYVGAYSFAIVYLGLGNKEEAIRWLGKGFQDRAGYEIGFIRVDPTLDPLRGDPRFEKLADQIVPPDLK